jgi:hypothetical protein
MIHILAFMCWILYQVALLNRMPVQNFKLPIYGLSDTFIVFLIRQHIRWKPTSSCKLWKLQSESHDVDPIGRSEEVGEVICKITFANHASHLP